MSSSQYDWRIKSWHQTLHPYRKEIYTTIREYYTEGNDSVSLRDWQSVEGFVAKRQAAL